VATSLPTLITAVRTSEANRFGTGICRSQLRGRRDARRRDRTPRPHLIVTRWGTRLTGANISGANFTGGQLVASDMSRATLEGAKWDDEAGAPPFLDDGSQAVNTL
jgi:uncharacterized protein YjbI with pentapeptide repeats